MHSTNYTDTLILPAADCPVRTACVPARPGTIAALQYNMLSGSPYSLTSDDLLVAIAARRGEIAPDQIATFRANFFSRGQACLRASPLAKSHGWAFHHDAQARVALIDPASPRFATLSATPGIASIPAMRNRRA